MRLISKSLSKQEIAALKKKYGDYLKLTIDLGQRLLVVGCELHADGEEILLEKGSLSTEIWGGGINLKTKTIDTIAVLNLRPNLGNPSMEILDFERRKKFIKIVKKIFVLLWD